MGGNNVMLLCLSKAKRIFFLATIILSTVTLEAFSPFTRHHRLPTKSTTTTNTFRNIQSRSAVSTIDDTATITTTTLLNVKKAKKEEDEEDKPWILFDTIKATSPGTLIAAPFVVLVGLDLVFNIFFLFKRTVEFFLLGKAPSTEVWFSDNFFL
jgi:hypothetical protein